MSSSGLSLSSPLSLYYSPSLVPCSVGCLTKKPCSALMDLNILSTHLGDGSPWHHHHPTVSCFLCIFLLSIQMVIFQATVPPTLWSTLQSWPLTHPLQLLYPIPSPVLRLHLQTCPLLQAYLWLEIWWWRLGTTKASSVTLRCIP